MQQVYPGQQQSSGAFNGNHGPQPESGSPSSPASTAATGTAVGSGGKTNHLNNGGRFDFDDGGTYCGGWEDGKAHGHGVCTGPKGQGAYSGSWHFGFEVSGVYTWPSGSAYEGQWQNGKRHGLGVESRGRWIYRGEWTQGFKGRYGVRQSTTSTAKYEGTWANGLQDGYGSETYADGGTYQGQWLRGMRHGYGVRASAPFGLASHCRPKQSLRASMTSLRSNEAFNSSVPAGSSSSAANAVAAAAERDRRVDDARGGFVLKAKSDEPPHRRRSLVEKSLKKSILSGLKMRKQRSTGDLDQRVTSAGSLRSNASSASWVSMDSSQEVANGGGSFHTDSNASFVVEDEHMDANVTETYMGEWKNDKRSGFGISERSDGLRYEGEWFNNKKYGYGVTILRDGSREEGKYKNNVLITSQKKKHIFLIRSAKFRERIDAAVNAAQRASKIALQKADIAISRMATSRGKAEQADACAYQAREDFEVARITAKQFDPDFTLPSLEKLHLRDLSRYRLSLDDKFSSQQTTQSSASSTNEHTHHRPAAAAIQSSMSNQIPNSIPPLPPRAQSTAGQNPYHRPSMQFHQSTQQQQQPQQYTQGGPTNTSSGNQPTMSPSSKSQLLSNSIVPPHRHHSPQRYPPDNNNINNNSSSTAEYNQQQFASYSRTSDELKQRNNQTSIASNPYLHSGNNDNNDHNFSSNNMNNNSNSINNSNNPNNNPNNPNNNNAIPSARLPNDNYYVHQNQQQQFRQSYPSSSDNHPNPYASSGSGYLQQHQSANTKLSNATDSMSSSPPQHHYPAQRPPTLNYSPKSYNQQQQQYNQQFRHNSSQFTDSPSPHHRNPPAPHLSDSMRQHSFDMPSSQSRLANEKSFQHHHQMNKMNSIESASPYQQQQQQQQQHNRNVALRRNSRLVTGDSPYAPKQLMSDHFGHYERPPSRDGSEDRYTRAASRLSGGSRQPSVDRTRPPSSLDNSVLLPTAKDRSSRSGSVVRGTTSTVTGNGSVIGGTGLGGPISSSNSSNTRNPTPNQIQYSSQLPFEDIILRKRSLGQDILPSPIGQPKRTESLYVSSGSSTTGGTVRKESQNKDTHTLSSLQRKKSLPDFQGQPPASTPMSREEVSLLSSARREEMRRLQEENERLRANPFLYLVSPHVKDWFSRQQLLMVILFINISLAIIFFKLLTS